MENRTQSRQLQRRELLVLLGGCLGASLGASFGGPMGARPARAQATAQVVAREYGAWGFDLSGADLAAKPGDDFFRYGNGAWFDRTVLAPDSRTQSVETSLTDAAEARIRDILVQGETGGEPAARGDAAKISTFYSSFMDEARVETLDVGPIAPFLQAIRGANTHADLAELMAKPFFGSIFSLSIGIDAKAPDRYAVIIGQGGLGLPDRDYYSAGHFAGKRAAYLAYLTQLLSLIGWDTPQQFAASIVALEAAIAKVSWTATESQKSEKTYNPTTVARLAQTVPFPWHRFLQAAELANLDRLIVAEANAIPRIAAIYARTPIATLKAWQASHLVDATAPYLSNRFVTANFEFDDKALSGVTKLPQRWKRGVRLVESEMGDAIGRIYMARHFNPQTKAQVEDMVEEIRLAMKGRIERVAWMSPKTKAKALDKLARLRAKVGYPNRWRDYSGLEVRADDLFGNVRNARVFGWRRKVARLNAPVDRDEWDMTPQTGDAYYNSNLNEVVLPARQLQAPFFDPAADPAVNYGGIGSLIGHELTHGFDDDGRKFDGSGALSNWWTPADAREFRARAAKLSRQYSAFEPFPGAHVNGDLTLDENIADLGGLLVALDAYHHSLAGKPAPVLDGLTGDQRFFLGYAQTMRAKKTEDEARQQLVSDSHAPERYRVNGVVRNMDAWYQAFDVRAGDKLYLPNGQRVQIW